MSRHIVMLLCLTAIGVVAADDPWVRVKELKTGQELRIIRRDAKQPVMAKMDEVTSESLVVIIRDQQVSIPKDQIERIDARPVHSSSRVTRESKVSTTNPDRITGPATEMNRGGGGQRINSSTGFSIGGRPDFEPVYRRQAGTPADAAAQK